MAEEEHPFLPEQDYEDPNVISTYDFIYFVDDYSPFLREYLDHLYDTNDPEEADDNGYFKSFIDICSNIDTNQGDDGTFESYRATLEPFMEFMTQSCDSMNAYYEEQTRNRMELEGQENIEETKNIASRTRSKGPASGFEIPQSKRGTNVMTQGPTTQDAVRIKLSDGKEYTYGEVKHMMEWNKNMTPYRHPYTPGDKQKINELLEFAKGGKKTRKNKRKARKTKKTRKTKSKKAKKNKTNNKRQH
jgi:hypothetical protein